MFNGLGADIRFGLRMLIRHPWSTVSIAGTLAVGISATTAIYAIFNFVLFRPVPGVPSEAHLVTVEFRPIDKPKTSAYGNRAGLPVMRKAAAIERLGYASPGTYAVATPGSQPTLEGGELISSEYFSALGVVARFGRLFTDEETDAGAQNLAVVSERFARVKFDGDPNGVGKVITINGFPFTVIGVVSRYRGWGRTRVGETDVWLPIGTERLLARSVDTSMRSMVGRVRDRVSPQLLEQQLRSAYAGVASSLPTREQAFVPWVYSGLFTSMPGNAAAVRLYWLLMAGVLVLLALSCANAANLLLARVARRRRDLVVRLAIGASRWRITRQLLVESFGLAIVAGALGVLAGLGLTKALEGMRLLANFPELHDVPLDERVIAFSLVVTVATVVAFGLLPALMASRSDARGALGRSERTFASPHRFRSGLVVVQIALSLALLSAAGVFNRSLQNLFMTDLGADLDHVVALSLKPDQLGYNRVRSTRVVADAVAALEQSAIGRVAISFPQPLTSNGGAIRIKTEGMTEFVRQKALESSVSPSYFSVLGIPLLSGRTFADAESREASAVNPMPVILNERLARNVFGTDQVVGRIFDVDRDLGAKTLTSVAVVIGVAGDTRSLSVRGEPQPVLYHARESGWRYGVIVIKADRPDGVAMEKIRAVVQQVDPMLPITSLGPLRDLVATELSEDRVLARMSGLLALLAALLSATGVASVVSQLVLERTREFGIRSALGASNLDILGQIVGGVVGRSVVGVVLGVALYWGASRWLETRLYGLGVLDPGILAIAAAALVATSIVAALLPAIRASRIDPIVALRAE